MKTLRYASTLLLAFVITACSQPSEDTQPAEEEPVARSIQVPDTGSVTEAPGKAEDDKRDTVEEFIAAFKTAFDANDQEAIEALHYWGDTPEDLRAGMMQMFDNSLGMKIKDAEFVPLGPGVRPVSVKRGGVTYGPNVEVAGVIDYAMVYEDASGNVSSTTSEQTIGTVDGVYFFSGLKEVQAPD